MRSILLTAFAAAIALTASAHEIKAVRQQSLPEPITDAADVGTFRGKYNLDRPVNLQKKLAEKTSGSFRAPALLSDTELVTAPQGDMKRYAMSANIFLSNLGTVHVGGFGAESITGTDGSDFYTKAFTLNFYQQGYSKGKIEGDVVVFQSGQYVYNTPDGEKAYMYSAYLDDGEDWPEMTDKFVLSRDEEGRYVSEPGYYIVIMTEEEAKAGINEDSDIICFGTDYVFTPLPSDLKENTPPSNAESFECQLYANSLYDYGDTVIREIDVKVCGDNIFVGRLSDYLPQAYLMGTRTGENTYTFDTHQYIGYFDEGDYPYIHEFAMVNPLYSDGESLYYELAQSITMTFNESKTILSLEEDAGIFVCAYADLSDWSDAYWNMMIGDFDRPSTPRNPSRVACYGDYGSTYTTFEWDNKNLEGMPLMPNKLWCEVMINGEAYIFSPDYYSGLPESTDRIYFNTTGVEGLSVGEFTTIYLYEYDGKVDEINSLGIRIGYQYDDEVFYTEVVYADGFEPIEDKEYIPSTPRQLVYYKEYYDNIKFKFDGKDIDGNPIPERLLAAEIMLDGKPLVFREEDYYFNGGEGDDVTLIGLAPHSINYDSYLVSRSGSDYTLTLWAHEELPEFNSLSIRIVCTGAETFTYGDICEIVLERSATPANPWDVSYDAESKEFVFGALPIDTGGYGLAPWRYGYEVYVNDELYLFSADLYELDNDITLIPYEGFEYNYNFYLTTDYVYDESTWEIIDKKVVMKIDMDKEGIPEIRRIGVRAVYTDMDGKITRSEIINSDGTTGTLTGINNVGSETEPVRWFNLQGIEVANPVEGSLYLRYQNGKTTKVYVK